MRDIGKRYGIDLKQVPMVADTLRDLQAAAAAGCEPHLVLTGRAAELDADAVQALAAQVPGTRVHDDLPAFAEHLLSRGAATP
jgi:D-glycero-D-manno-heptose 1,7-bisphosphate phosphatase